MAKKSQDITKNTDSEEQGRKSRKDELIARKQERQLRFVRLGIAIVLGMIGLVLAVALINELVISPNRPVQVINGQEISLSDWQDRVQYERAQRVIFLENQLEAFGGDVGIVQQFGGQVINELLDPEAIGQLALDATAEELIICNALEERGITITEADVDAEIGSTFNFFDGASPTSQPLPTATVQPTPSLTPIPTAVITDVLPTATVAPTATAGPPATPIPTPTPVSQESFDEQFGGLLTSFEDKGIDEATYRSVVRAQLCRDRLADALVEEQGLATVAPHTSLFLLAFDDEEQANETLAEVQNGDFLTQWNTVQSTPAEDIDPDAPQTFAFELLWRTRDNLEASAGPALAEAAFGLDVNETSEVIAVDNGDGTSTYYIVMPSGREDRELQPGELEARRQELVDTYVTTALAGSVQISELWRQRVPERPRLDPGFLAAPTPAPTELPVEVVPTETGE